MTINILQGVRRAKCNILAEHVDIDDISEWVFAREFLKNNGREQMSEAHRFSEKGKKKMLEEVLITQEQVITKLGCLQADSYRNRWKQHSD